MGEKNDKIKLYAQKSFTLKYFVEKHISKALLLLDIFKKDIFNSVCMWLTHQLQHVTSEIFFINVCQVQQGNIYL